MDDALTTSVFKNADEMKIITKEAAAKKETNEIFDVMAQIIANAEEGICSTSFDSLYPSTKRKLALLGYKVTQERDINNFLNTHYVYVVDWS